MRSSALGDPALLRIGLVVRGATADGELLVSGRTVPAGVAEGLPVSTCVEGGLKVGWFVGTVGNKEKFGSGAG